MNTEYAEEDAFFCFANLIAEIEQCFSREFDQAMMDTQNPVGRYQALLALYAIIMLVRNLLEPRVMAAQAGLPPLTALLAMYLGFCLFGVGGMILFPILLLFVKQLQDGGFLHLWK